MPVGHTGVAQPLPDIAATYMLAALQDFCGAGQERCMLDCMGQPESLHCCNTLGLKTAMSTLTSSKGAQCLQQTLLAGPCDAFGCQSMHRTLQGVKLTCVLGGGSAGVPFAEGPAERAPCEVREAG